MLQVEPISANALKHMENRIGDCEICQEACPWNRKHLDKPLISRLAHEFQPDLSFWSTTSYLPKLSKFTEAEYTAVFGQLGTGIPYHIFHRNVMLALNRAGEQNPRSES
jgi:epoxyqueuosine reductase QueG